MMMPNMVRKERPLLRARAVSDILVRLMTSMVGGDYFEFDVMMMLDTTDSPPSSPLVMRVRLPSLLPHCTGMWMNS